MSKIHAATIKMIAARNPAKTPFNTLDGSITRRLVRRDDVEQGLAALKHGLFGPSQRIGKIGGALDALGTRALRNRKNVIGWGRVEIGKETAVVLAGGAVLEHRQRGAAHRAIPAVVEEDRQDREVLCPGN